MIGAGGASAQTLPAPALKPPVAPAAKPAQPGAAAPPPRASSRPVAATLKAAPKTATAKPATGKPAAPQDDQSYLFTKGPKEQGGPPSYITSGSRSFNQPWYMTIYDTTGGW
ncbi:MAG: hypothetical protein U1E62_13495 [Alsobacter sp.]